jgi:hypothetical protein
VAAEPGPSQKEALTCRHPFYGDLMDDRFEDAWDALDDDQRCLLLATRDTERPAPEVVALLVKARLVIFGAGFGPLAAPAHWPIGLRDFLDDKAAVVDEDPECE